MKTDFSLETPISTDLVRIAMSTFYHTTSCPKNKLFNQISSARKVSTFLWAKSDSTRIIREDLLYEIAFYSNIKSTSRNFVDKIKESTITLGH